MNRYRVCSKVLREREYYDTTAYQDLFEYAGALMESDDFVGDAAVLGVTAGNPNLYLLNLTAALVLEAVRLGMGRQELVVRMMTIFEVELDRLEPDVDEATATLLEAGIIEEVDSDKR